MYYLIISRCFVLIVHLNKLYHDQWHAKVFVRPGPSTLFTLLSENLILNRAKALQVFVVCYAHGRCFAPLVQVWSLCYLLAELKQFDTFFATLILRQCTSLCSYQDVSLHSCRGWPLRYAVAAIKTLWGLDLLQAHYFSWRTIKYEIYIFGVHMGMQLGTACIQKLHYCLNVVLIVPLNRTN